MIKWAKQKKSYQEIKERLISYIIIYSIKAPLSLPKFIGYTHKNQTNLKENLKYQI